MATAPAIIMCWHPTMNCTIQNNAIKLYHRATFIVTSLTYNALVLFSMINLPELSIHIVKYIQSAITDDNAIKVYVTKEEKKNRNSYVYATKTNDGTLIA